MCECGCGELNGIGRLRGPGKTWYVLGVYPGCPDCGTDWAIGVMRLKEGTDEWVDFVQEYPKITFGQHGEWGRPILKTDVLLKAFMEEIGEDDDLAETPFALSEFVNRGGLIEVHRKSVAPVSEEGE